jgi:predicted nucleic acid-binding Zn ribbon protein
MSTRDRDKDRKRHWSEDQWRSAPRPVADGLEHLARRLGAPTASSLGVVFSRWEEVVGPVIAAHTAPRSLIDGVLVVSVDQPGWATQLRYLSTDLLQRLKDVAGPGVVGRIDIRVDGGPQKAKRPPFRAS